MKYLVDSDITISYLNGREEAGDFLQKIRGKFGLSVISLGEILEGVYGEANEEKRLADIKDFLTKAKLLNVDRKVAQEFAKSRSVLRKKGDLLDNMDLLIAFTALIYDLILLTKNKRHFGRLKELKLIEL